MVTRGLLRSGWWSASLTLSRAAGRVPRQQVQGPITGTGADKTYMDSFQELLAVDHREALAFFVLHLQDIAEPTVDRQELLYNASVLAHYAQVSTRASGEWPVPANLTAVFDHFVADSTVLQDGGMMEIAGAQCLLLAGFFEDQMRARHNIRWYAELGAGFFSRAARYEASAEKARLLESLAKGFEPWRRRHAQLSRELRTQPYVLSVRPPASDRYETPDHRASGERASH